MRAVVLILISFYLYYFLCINKNMDEITTKRKKEKSIIKFYQLQFELKNL